MSYDRKFEPTEVTKGERIAWTRTFRDFPASLYTCEYRFRGLLGSGAGLDIAATADGDDYDVVISATNSATLSVTKYGWQAWLTEIADSNNKFRVADGLIDVLAGFVHGTTTAIDSRTPAKIMLDTIDAALLAFATSDILEYEMSTPAGNKRVKRSDKMQLTAERKYWATVVAQEAWRARVRRGGKFAAAVKVSAYED